MRKSVIVLFVILAGIASIGHVSAWTEPDIPVLVGSFGADGNAFTVASDLVVDSSGDIWVRFSGTFYKYNQTGTRIANASAATNARTFIDAPFAVDTSGNIYYTDENAYDFPYTSKVYRQNSSGMTTLTLGDRREFENGRFYHFLDLDVDAEGNIYVMDQPINDYWSRIQIFNSSGTYLGSIVNSYPPTQRFAVDDSHNVYTAGSPYSYSYTWSYSAQTGFVYSSFNNYFSGSYYTINGIDADMYGNTYSSNFRRSGDGGSRFKKITKTGVISEFATVGSDTSRDVGVTNTGDIFILDTTTGLIYHYQEQHKFSPTATFSLRSDTSSEYTATVSVYGDSVLRNALSNVVSIKLSEDSSFTNTDWEPYAASKSFTLSAGQAVKTVYAQYKDDQGNESPVYSDSITYDTDIPTGAITIQQGNLTNNTAVTVQLSATDNVSGIASMKVSEDQNFASVNWENFATTTSFTLSTGDGTKTVYAKFKDGAGNESIVYSASIVLDQTGPTGTLSINNDAVFTKITQVTLGISSTDATSQVTEMAICDTNTFTDCTFQPVQTVLTWTLPAGEGNKIVYAKFKDIAGNESSVFSDDIVFDITGPKIEFVAPLVTYTTKNPVIKGVTWDSLREGYTETVLAYEQFTAGTNQNWNDDDSSWHYNFANGFTFPLYDTKYDSMYVSSNGRICFSSGSALKTGALTDSSCGAFVAPFWTDLGQSENTDKISIKQESTYVQVDWKSTFTNNRPSGGVIGGGTAQGWHADDSDWNYTLPFTFPFYGINYSQIVIGSNGGICLTSNSDCSWFPNSINSTYSSPMILPLGVDLMTNRSAQPDEDIYITELSDRVIIRWQAEDYSNNHPINFEAVLFATGDIIFNYGEQGTPPLRYEPIVGVLAGDGIRYTASVYNNILDFNGKESVRYTYNGTNYTESVVAGGIETIDFTIQTKLFIDGQVQVSYGGAYDFSAIYGLTKPVVGVSKGNGSTYFVSTLSDTGFKLTNPTTFVIREKPQSTIKKVEFNLDGSSVTQNCTPQDNSFNSFTENFICLMNNLANGNHTLNIKATDSADNFSTLIRTFFVDVPITKKVVVPVKAETIEPTLTPEVTVTVSILPSPTAVAQPLIVQFIDEENSPLVGCMVTINGSQYKTDDHGKVTVMNVREGDYAYAIKVGETQINSSIKVSSDELIKGVKTVNVTQNTSIKTEKPESYWLLWFIVSILAGAGMMTLFLKLRPVK